MMVHSRIYMFSSLLGGLLFCFVTLSAMTWSSSIIPKLTNLETSPFGRVIDTDEASWISSILTIGAMLGVIIFGYLTDKIGRKLTLLLSLIPYLISNLVIAFATSVNLYYLARFLMGLSMGTIFVLPLYISELTHKSHRGALGSLIGCAYCSGTLFSNVLGPFVSIKTFSLTLAAISGLSVIFFAFLAEEVPQFYIIKNKESQARAALEKLHGIYGDTDYAILEIQSYYFAEKACKLRDILTSKPFIKASIICVGLVIFQQFSGIVAITFYGQTFFQGSSLGLSPEIAVIALGSVQLISSFLTPPLCARFGKKFLLCLSGAGMAFSEIILAAYSYFGDIVIYPKYLSVLPIVCLTIFIIHYNIGCGPLTLIIVGESFPTRVKALTTSVLGCMYYLCSFIITKYFMQIVEVVGLYRYFAFSAACCFLAVIFVKFYVIETKGKSLEKIQQELSR